DEAAVDGVAVEENLDGARGERERWRPARHVAGDERREPGGAAGHERERDAPEKPRLGAKPLDHPERDEGAEEERRLAGQHGEREQHTRDEPARHRVARADEAPEEKERGGDGERVAQEERLVQEKRAVERRPDRGDRGYRASEETRGEQEDERHAGDPEERLAEADAPEPVARHQPHAGERVRGERRLIEDVLPAPRTL